MRLLAVSAPRTAGRAAFERAAPLLAAVAGAAPPRRALVSVALVGERRMAGLNRRFKGRRGTAEILTFSYRGDPVPGGEAAAGEICLCWRALERGARRRGVPPRIYAARLLVHGMLHLRGFRHDVPGAERRMERAERLALEKFVAARELARLFA